jgi:hypothetical protein
MPKRGLGRGFDSLIPTQMVEDEFDVTAGWTRRATARSGTRCTSWTRRLLTPTRISRGSILTRCAGGAGGEHPRARDFAAAGGD